MGNVFDKILYKLCTCCGGSLSKDCFYKKGNSYTSKCKQCTKDEKKKKYQNSKSHNEQYLKSSPLIPKPNFESIHVDVTLVSGNDWSSIVFSILKSNFLESNDPQSTEDIKINNKLSGIAKE